MSIQIIIRNKDLFKKKIDFNQMISSLKLDYGAYDDFSVLEHKKFYQTNQCILFNPKRIGLGIFFDGNKMNKGFITIVLQTFSTLNEIECLYDIVKYISEHYKKMDMYVNEEYITYGVFLSLKEKIQKIALDNLTLGCKRTIDYLYDLRMAFNPITLSEEIREKFGYSNNLEEFEEYIHNKQKDKIYYAAPKLKENIAYYTLKENCISIFPLNGNDYYNDNEASHVFIQFEGLEEKYSYKKFINIFKSNEKYDDNHIYIKEMGQIEINNIINKLKEN
ncbi:MAG: hypothetical protein R3Y05_04605 [bacterium]